jgi:hypothetical protein
MKNSTHSLTGVGTKTIKYSKTLLSLLFLFSITLASHAQLLQWNTFGNAGTEPTEPSVANDANIAGSVNLTNGGGWTPAANPNRFGGSGWFNTGNTVAGSTISEAIAGNDYIQFTVSPNGGYSFTATSLVFTWDRSGTGPANVALRSSADSYSTDLGVVTGMSSGGVSTTTIRTLNIAGITNITSVTTFRLYGYGATGTGGTGGFDNASSVVNVTLNGTTVATATPSLSAGALADFGAQCTGGTYGPNSFTLTGSNLTSPDVTVASLAGFTYDTLIAGPYYSSLSIPHGLGAFSKTIYVNFSPVAVTSYNGNIAVSGGGATSINVAATGSGVLAGPPTITTPAATNIGATTATLGGNITSLNCSSVTVRGIEWSLTPGFADGAGTPFTESGTFTAGTYTLNVTGLPSASTIYFKAFATNASGTSYTTQSSFNTYLNVGDISIIGFNSNTPDNFNFVTWVDLPVGTVIKFTDNGFLAAASANAAGNGRGGENFVKWTNTTAGPILAGTVIKMEGATASLGTAVQGLTGLTNGEQIFAYQGTGLGTLATNSDFGSNANPSTFTGWVLYGINWQGSGGSATWTGANNTSTSFLPTELNVANGNITHGGNAAGGQYTGTRNGQMTFAGYKTLVNNPSNWTNVTTGIVTLNQTSFVLSTGGPTQIVVTNINGGTSPTVNAPFTIDIEMQDGSNIGASCIANTDVVVTLTTGSGALAGTLTGTVLAGTSTLTISGVLYNTAEAGVSVTVTRTAGDVVTPGTSAAFTVLPAADHIAFNNLGLFAFTNTVVGFFNVEARRPDNSVDNTYTGNATISLISGTGALLGTLVKPFVNGIALFNDISFNTAGVKEIDANAGVFATIQSSPITVATPGLIENYLPQYMQGTSVASNPTRTPFACRVTLNGLQPTTTYRYTNQMVEAADGATVSGAGNPIYVNAAGFVRTTSASLSTLGGYGEFTTDAAGQYAGWFAVEPTGNARFTTGNSVFMRIVLNNGAGGTFAALRLTTSNSVSVINFGTASTNGTALRGNSSAIAKNFVLMYDNVAGTGRPIAVSFVESDGSANNLSNSYAPFYATSVEGVPGAYGTIVPNTLPNGIRRVEQRSLAQGLIVSCAATDTDGIWPSGVNTVNPNTGATAKVFTTADAEFNPACITLTPGNNDNFLSAVLAPTTGIAYPQSQCYNNTLVGASVSSEGTAANVLVTGGQDRWYAIVAPSPAVRIATTSTSMDIVLELHASDGSLIDTENDVAGIGGEIMATNGLLEGYTYFVAVRSYDGVLGNFSICMQALFDSRCTDGSGSYDLCNSFKPRWTGANLYTFNFTPTGATPGVATSATSTGQIPLSNATLALRHTGTYDARIDVTYNLLDGAGNPETVTVIGNEICAITIAPHASVEVKTTQRCPATLLKGSVLFGKPFVCAANNFTVEFTEVTDCTGATTVGFPFTATTAGASSSIQLGFVSGLLNNAWYKVRWQPNFTYGAGSYGLPQVIFIGGSAMDEVSMNATEDEEKNASLTQAALYPNPSNGDMININLVNLTSDVVSVRVMDGTGRVVCTRSYVAEGSLNTTIVFEQSLANGVYLVEFNTGKDILTERLMVQK